MNNEPNIVRVRHELIRRRLTVARIETPGPRMRRIVLTGEELRGFTSPGFDDHIKLFFPSPESDQVAPGAAGAAMNMRDYTPQHFDPHTLELSIDFFLHDDGPASSWAAHAAPGQELIIGGPKGSSLISTDGIVTHLLVGDETALPAIGRRLSELGNGQNTLVVVECEHQDAYPLTSHANLQVIWAMRQARATAPGDLLIDALRSLQFDPQHCFAWIATESHAARAVRRYLIDERGLNKAWVKAAAYWRQGAAASHEVIQD